MSAGEITPQSLQFANAINEVANRDKITSSETPRTLPEYVKCITDDGQELPMRRCPACKKPSFIGYRCDGCDLAAERERADRAKAEGIKEGMRLAAKLCGDADKSTHPADLADAILKEIGE